MTEKMKGKKIVVSGAANGVGTAICCELLKQGAFFIGIDLEPFNGSELARKLNSSVKEGRDFRFFQGDASNWQTMKEVFEEINTLDGLVNNAGFLGGDNSHGGRNVESFAKMIKSHAQSALVLTELSYRKMVNGGSIVNIGSIDLRMIMPEAVLYGTAKGALWGLTVSYCNTLAGNKIRVNMVSPGNVNTERNKAQYVDVKELVDHFEEKTPLRRSAEPEEIAKVVLFLLSSESSFITGENIVVDGGYTRASWDPSWTKENLTEVYK